MRLKKNILGNRLSANHTRDFDSPRPHTVACHISITYVTRVRVTLAVYSTQLLKGNEKKDRLPGTGGAAYSANTTAADRDVCKIDMYEFIYIFMRKLGHHFGNHDDGLLGSVYPNHAPLELH